MVGDRPVIGRGTGCAPGKAWEEEVDGVEIGEDLRVAQ